MLDADEASRSLVAALPALGPREQGLRGFERMLELLTAHVARLAANEEHEALDPVFEVLDDCFRRGSRSVRASVGAFLIRLSRHQKIEPADYVWKVGPEAYAYIRLFESTRPEES